MASSAPELAPQQKKQLRDKDWEPWKDLVYTEYIVNDMEVDEVVAELDHKGFVVDRGKLQSKLKSWGFRKKLEPDIWRYLSHVIRDRRNLLRKNTTVILSGRRIPQEKVENNISRHGLPRWNPLIPPAPPDELPLYICTPRGSSTDLVIGTRDPAQYCYPDNLPWFQFLNTDLPVVLRGIEFLRKLPKKATSALAGPEATQELLQIVQCRDVASLPISQKLILLPAAFEQVVRRCLGIAIGSEDMAFQLLARKSIDRLAAHFDMIFPQAFPDENLRRAATLAGGSVADIQLELLKVLLFLVSNGLILTEDPATVFMVDQARPIIGLCQFAGLSQLPTLRKLVNLSHRSLTITAIINTLFKAAVLTGAAGFVSNLLKADCRLQPDSMVKFFILYDRIASYLSCSNATPLEFALSQQYENLVKVLVGAGANLPETRWVDWSMLAVAIYERSPDTLVQLLIHHGASINGYGFESLHAAFITGNLHLIERLVAGGAHLNHRYRASYFSKPFYSTPFAMSTYFYLFRYLDDVGCLGFAASFHSATMTTKYDKLDDHWETFAKDQDKALELCNAIHLKYRPQMDLSDDRMVADAMIIASARGYTKVINFLRQKFSARVDVPSGYLSPLYAAVGWKQVEATKTLLQLGAYLPPTVCSVATPYTLECDSVFSRIPGSSLGSTRITVECPAPSLLQLAVAQNSCELGELLIQAGVDIDEEREIALKDGELFWPPLGRPSPTYSNGILEFRITTARLAPFQLAVRLGQWNVALTLLRHKATATVDDLFAAAAEGQLALVEQLLGVGIPANVVKNGVTAYEAALQKGHGAVAARLATARCGDSAEDFASVFRIPDVAHIRTHVPSGLLKEPGSISRDRGGRSYLENAFLSHDKGVIMMALELDALAYDSGALCAEVLFLAKSGQKTPSPSLMELLRRRSLHPDSIHVTPSLENYAVSIAAWYSCPGILDALLTSRTSALAQAYATPSSMDMFRLQYAFLGEGFLDKGDDRSIESSPFDQNWHVSPPPMISPLRLAAEGYATEQIMERLLEAGFKPDGFTLRAAILRNPSIGLIERLLESCDDIDANCAPGPLGEHDQTPLCAAIRHERIDIVKALLVRGADINAVREGIYYTALYTALGVGSLPVIDLLLDAGAEVNNPAPSMAYGRPGTVLQLAAQEGLIGLVRRFIACGADVNARRSRWGDCHGTALEAAAMHGRLDTVHLLLDAGTDTEGYGRFQFVNATALAFYRGHGAVVDLLKSHREWTGEDTTIWDQLHDNTEKTLRDASVGYHLHPLEFSPNELINELAESRVQRYNTCSVTTPGSCDQIVASLIKDRVTEVTNGKHNVATAVAEEAARFTIQAIRKWSEESGTPLPCSSIWNAEDGLARRPVQACNVCGFKVWYYLPCSLKSREKELRQVVEQSLRQWSPSWLTTTSKDGDGMSKELETPSPIGSVGLQETLLEDPTFSFSEWDDTAMIVDSNTARHGLPDSYDTPMLDIENDSRDGCEDSEEWRMAILADIRGERELPLKPIDNGW